MTDRHTAFRLAVYYRALATASFLVGAGIALAGLWLGLGDAVTVFLGSFLEDDVMSQTMAAANLPLTAVLVAVGVTVWQVGKATAFYWTLGTAFEAAAPAGSGVEDAASDVHGRPAGEDPTGATASPGADVPDERPQSSRGNESGG